LIDQELLINDDNDEDDDNDDDDNGNSDDYGVFISCPVVITSH